MDQPPAPFFDEPIRQSLRQPFRMGRVLERSVSAFTRNFFPFFFLGVIVYLPLLIYLAIVLSDETMFIEAADVWPTVVGGGGGLLSLILTAAVIYGTFRQLRGEPTTMGRSITIGLSRLLPVLGVGILMGLIIFLGLVALVVPGLILYCMLYVAIPVAVVERPGIGASLGRSSDLTKGHRWPIFGLILLVGVASGVSNYTLERIFLDDPTLSSVKVYMVCSVLLSLLFGLFGSVMNAVAYHDLRAAKETVDLEQLTSIFE